MRTVSDMTTGVAYRGRCIADARPVAELGAIDYEAQPHTPGTAAAFIASMRFPGSSKQRVTVFIGTRPELIKLAPVVNELRASAPHLTTRVVFSGQHRELLQSQADSLGIHPDADLSVMRAGQSLNQLSSRLFESIDRELAAFPADYVVVQGDTSTSLVAAMASFNREVPVAHVEAGLRTADLHTPFPEEANRRLIGRIASLHFAPTLLAQANLLKETISSNNIVVCGNTAIDTLTGVARTTTPDELPHGFDQRVLITVHRRENQGSQLQSVLDSIRILARKRPRTEFVFPVHPTPRIRQVVHSELSNIPNVKLIEPLGYKEFVALLLSVTLVMSDSGGLQEECPSLRIPVLVLRDTTERPEAVNLGANMLVGTSTRDIIHHVERLLDSPSELKKMQTPHSPYGDGRASVRIVQHIVQHFTQPNSAVESFAMCA